MPLAYFSPISTKALNNNMDDDLELTGFHGLTAAYLQLTTGSYAPPASYGGILLDDDLASINVVGGTANSKAASMQLCGKDHPLRPGDILFFCLKGDLSGTQLAMMLSHGTPPSLEMYSTPISGLPTPTGDTMAATKKYVDDHHDHHGDLTGLTDDDHVRYLDKNGAKAWTGDMDADAHALVDTSYIRPSVETYQTTILGGIGAGGTATPAITVYGNNHPTYPGDIDFFVPNAAKSTYLTAMRIVGNTDTPSIFANSNRITSLGQATTDMDAVPLTKKWTTWTATISWTGATPASASQICRYCQIGKVVFFTFYIASSDSNACTGCSLTLPVASANSSLNYHFQAFEGYGTGGSTYKDPLGYVAPNENPAVARFLLFSTATDGQAVYVQGTGWYEAP